MKNNGITEYFVEVETKEKYSGYLYGVAEAITIVILGSLCGLKNMKRIHQWAENDRVRKFLREEFGIERIPCYFWLTALLKLVKPESLSHFFTEWVKTLLPDDRKDRIIACDGKTVCSTEKMKCYTSPLHIVSAYFAELGMTFAQQAVEDKSNEIPALQNLLSTLEIKGCLIVADALNCQKRTAKVVVEKEADYLLVVKNNQGRLHEDIENYIHQSTQCQGDMDEEETVEKNRGRIETRIGYTSCDISVIRDRGDWANLACFGAIHRKFQTRDANGEWGPESDEWHYYISSRPLSAAELLHYARMEWQVESMHWLLDVHFGEDSCRLMDENEQKNFNVLRKAALNLLKSYQAKSEPKRALSELMFNCLLEPDFMLKIISRNGG